MIMTAAATIANTAGRLAIQPVQRDQAGDSSRDSELAGLERAALAAAQHVAPEEAEHRRQQRQRREHRERHRDRGRDRDAVEEAHAEREHPEHRDADDHPREQDRTPGGVDRLNDGVLAAQAAQDPLPVAGDDEQRVVDPDAEADQQRELVRERGHGDHVREQADDRDAGAEREPGGQQAGAASRGTIRRPRTGRPRRRGNRSTRLLDELSCWPAWAIWPSTSNCSPLPEAEVTFDTNAFACELEILLGCRSKVTLAKPIWPEGEICLTPRAV